MSKIDVCYMVSHGFAARMILQTGLLKKLAGHGLKVGLICPDKNDSYLSAISKEYDFQIFEYKTEKKWGLEYFRMRKYFLEDINKNPALLEKHQKSLTPFSLKNLRFYGYKLLHDLKFIFPFISKQFRKREQKYLHDEETSKFLTEINPRLLVSTYPVNLEEALLLHNASNQNITTVIHLLSWDNITAKGHFPALADKYIAWGPIMKNEFISHYGMDEENVFIAGVPHFDLHVKNRSNLKYVEHLTKNDLNPDIPYLFFAMSSPHFAPGEIEIVEDLSQKISEDYFDTPIQMIVRPHPQNVVGNMADLTWISRLNKLTSEHVYVNMPNLASSQMKWSMEHEDMIYFSELLAGSAVCLNSGSTVSIDALMCNKPVIITSFDGERNEAYHNSARRLIKFTHLKKFVNLGGASVTKSFDELYMEINAYIKNPDRNIERRNYAAQQECGVLNGRATEEVVNSILSIYTENPRQVLSD